MAQGCKKVVASGARTTVLMQEERCYGILNAKVSDEQTYLGTWKRLELTSESIVNEISTLQSAALNPDRSVRRRMQGTSAIGGDINVELANNGYGWMITQAIGKIVGTGTSADPYTIVPVDSSGVASDCTAGFQQDSALYNDVEIHYDASCSDVASDSAGFESGYYTLDPYGMEPGFTLLVSRDGTTIKNASGVAPTDQLWFKHTGCGVNTWSVSASPTEIITSVFSVLGRQEAVVDIPAPSYVERPANIDPFTGFNGDAQIDGTDICILSFEMSLNNNLGADQFCLGDRYRNSLPAGQRVIEGTITLEFTDLVFYTKFLNGTSAIVTIDFDLFGDNTETLKIILPKVEFNGTTPTAGGNEAISQELPFIALWDTAPAENLLVKGVSNVAPNGFDIAVEIVTAGALV